MSCLPFFQIDTEWIEHGAGDLGALLDVEEGIAGWSMVRVWTWVVSRQWSRDTPPDGHVEGAGAERLVEHAAGWRGEPGAFVGALVELGLAERTATGLRLRGTDRYRAAWEKQRKDRERQQGKRAGGEGAGESGDSAATSPLRRGDSRATSQGKTYTYTQKKPPSGASRADAREPPVAAPHPPREQHAHTAPSHPAPAEPAPAHHADGSLPFEAPAADSGPPLIELLEADFAAAREGKAYGRPHTDAGAMRELLSKPGASPEEIRTRWRQGLARRGFPRVSTLKDLATHWDACALPEEPRGTGPPNSPMADKARRAPSRGSDWSQRSKPTPPTPTAEVVP